MNINKKIDLLISYENLPRLDKKHIKKILKLSNDKESLIRDQVAALLINFSDYDISKEILLRLARDKKWLVRTEAYDSLSVFESKRVMKFLENAIQKEKNEIACAHAISVWAEIAAALDVNIPKKRVLVKKIKNTPRIQSSEHCLLACCYAQYIFGKKKALKKITGFLKSENYRIRCAAMNTLGWIMNDDNKAFIRVAIEDSLAGEYTVAVRSTAERVLKEGWIST